LFYSLGNFISHYTIKNDICNLFVWDNTRCARACKLPTCKIKLCFTHMLHKKLVFMLTFRLLYSFVKSRIKFVFFLAVLFLCEKFRRDRLDQNQKKHQFIGPLFKIVLSVHAKESIAR
jgi:hypothetical protein